jgi:glycosyltransferase involved in cell wall biosynthesis
MRKSRRERVMIVGPYPPPDTGVTMPFRLFCDWLWANRSEQYDVRIVRTNSGDKSLVSIFRPTVLLKLFGIGWSIFFGALAAKRIIIFGSNRFVTSVGCAMNLLMWPLGKRVSLRVFGGAYERYLESQPRPVRAFIRRVWSLSHRIVVQPRLVAEALLPVWPQKIRGVRNYREPVEDLPPRTYNTSHVRFMFAGNIRRTKGCGELFAAFSELRRRLREQNHDVRVTLDMYGPIYGVASEAPEGIEAAQQDADITFHGNVPNEVLRGAYIARDVFVFPSYWPTEGHSGALIEALFHGTPIVASDWRANPEVIQDGINGLLCKHHDVVTLADCMMRLALDVELRKKLSAGAVASARQYDVAVVCPELAEALGL